MTWTRDVTRPVIDDGHRYDSTLEYNVKLGLDRMGLVMGRDFMHHAQVDGVYYYEPDFTIYRAPDEFEFPQYIEVKPAEALYALRDRWNLPERFDGVEEFWMTQDDVRKVVPELAKPKRLAEETGCEVLVTSKLWGTQTLSATIGPELVTLERRHPGVNWRGHEKRVKRQIDQIYWAKQHAEWKENAAAREAEALAATVERLRDVRDFFAAQTLVGALFGGKCWQCNRWRDPEHLYRAADKTSDGRWALICRSHVD